MSFRSVIRAPEGKILISFDYCQVEVRILAQLSEDPNLCKMVHDGCIYRNVAARLFGIDVKDVTSSQRKIAKVTLLAFIYGQGKHAMMQKINEGAPDTQFTFQQAKKIQKWFKDKYPGISQFQKKCVHNCRKKGFVRSVAGRIRIFNRNDDENKLKRTAINSVIQGSASDILKESLLKIEHDRWLSKRSKIILQTHDEIVCITKKYDCKLVAKKIKQLMEGAASNCFSTAQHQVYFPVKVCFGYDYGQMMEKDV